MSSIPPEITALGRARFGVAWDECDEMREHVTMLLSLLKGIQERAERLLSEGKSAEDEARLSVWIAEYVVSLDDRIYEGPLKPEQIH